MTATACFCLNGCGKKWNEGEPGVIQFTENDEDPNLLGQVVTEAEAKEKWDSTLTEEEKELKKTNIKKICVYKIKNNAGEIEEIETYTKKEWLNGEYAAKIQNAYLGRDNMDLKIYDEDGATVIDFAKENTVVEFCKTISNNHDPNEKISKKMEMSVLECFYKCIQSISETKENIVFYCHGQPYRSTNIESYNGILFN